MWVTMRVAAALGASSPSVFFEPVGTTSLQLSHRPGPGEGTLASAAFGQLVATDGRSIWVLQPSGQWAALAQLPPPEVNRPQLLVVADQEVFWLLSLEKRRLWRWRDGAWAGPAVLGEAIGGRGPRQRSASGQYPRKRGHVVCPGGRAGEGVQAFWPAGGSIQCRTSQSQAKPVSAGHLALR